MPSMASPLKRLESYLSKHSEDNRRAFKNFLHQVSTAGHDWAKAMYPFASRYFSPLNPVFLFECLRWGGMGNLLPYVMVRDGLFPLAHFFLKNPMPPKAAPIFIFHEHLSPIIPEAWRDSCLYYRQTLLEKNKSLFGNKSEVPFVIKGFVNSSYASNEYKQKLFKMLKEETVERDLRAKTLIFNLFRDDIFLFRSSEDHFYDHFQGVFGQLSWAKPVFKERFESAHMRASVFLDFQEKFSCIADDYLAHQIVSSGGSPYFLKKREVLSKELLYRLSPFHGIVLSGGRPLLKKELLGELAQLYDFYKSKEVDSNFFRRVRSIALPNIGENNWYLSSET